MENVSMLKQNKMIAGMVALALCVGFVGCGKSTVEGEGGKKLTLVNPANQSLTQGETNDVAITVARSEWDGSVAVEFENLPNGVTIANPGDIPADDNLRNFTLQAAADADVVSDHVVKVIARGPDGMQVSETFKVSVSRKN
jgi:hypothetical protein